MAKNYKGFKYFESRPDIVKIFDELEAFHNYCRMEMIPFNEAHLNNTASWEWRNFEKSRNPKKNWNNGHKLHSKKPHPRSDV